MFKIKPMKKILIFSFAVLFCGFAGAQIYVSTQPQNKNAIIEEFTGVQCPNCPAGHTILASILTANPGRAFGIGYHPSNSSYTEPYVGNPDFRRSYLNAFYSTPYCGTTRFMPSAFVNRREWATDEKILSRTNWTASATTILGEPSPLNVGLYTAYNAGNDTLTVIVEVYFTGSVSDAVNLYVMFAENDLIAEQSSGGTNYVHKHVFRESLVPQWGDPITGSTATGALYTKTFYFDNTAGMYDMTKCEVSAFVYNTVNEEVISGYQVPVGQASAIADQEPELRLLAYPNPVHNEVNISISSLSGEEVYYTLLNAFGQEVMKASAAFPGAGTHEFSIAMDHLPAGLYLLNIREGDYQKTLSLMKD